MNFLSLSFSQTHAHTHSQMPRSLTGDFHEAMSEAKATPQIASQQLQRTAFSYMFAIFDDTVDIMTSISTFHFADDMLFNVTVHFPIFFPMYCE